MGWGYRTTVFAILFVVCSFAEASLSPFPETVNVALNRALVPVGFDNNDRVQVTVEGAFPETCYKIGPYHIHMDEVSRAFSIQQTAYKYGGICLQMLVPFTQTIDLGIVADGTWHLLDATTGRGIGHLPVDIAKSADADEYLYAPISDANVYRESGTEKTNLSLTGMFTDRCTRLKEVRIHYYTDVIVVQPIAEHIANSANCGQLMTRFVHTVALKDGLDGNFLLHVRAMNGQAINKVVDIRK